MSGSNPNDIPIRITTGSSAEQLEALKNGFKHLTQEAENFANAFDTIKGGEKAVAALGRTFGNLSRMISTVSGQVTTLNAATQAATATNRAAQELELRAQTPRQLASAAQSNDPQRVANATTFTTRQVNAANLERTQVQLRLNGVLDRDDQARTQARLNKDKNQATLLRNAAAQTSAEVKAVSAELRTLDGQLDRANARLVRLTEASQRIAEIERVASGIASRQRSVAVTAGFAATPQGQAAQRAAEAREIERQGNASLSTFAQGRAVLEQFNQRLQTRRGAFETGNAAAQATADATQQAALEKQGADIMRRSISSAARASSRARADEARDVAAEQAADARDVERRGNAAIGSYSRGRERIDRFLGRTQARQGAFETGNADAQAAADAANLADLQKQNAAIMRRSILAASAASARARADEASAATRAEAPYVAAQSRINAFNDPRLVAFNEQLRQLNNQRRDANTLADLGDGNTIVRRQRVGVASRIGSLDTEAAGLANPTVRGLLQSNQTTRMEINLEALVKSLQDTSSTLNELRVSAARAAQRIGQTASLQNAEDPAFNAGATRLGVANIRRRADVADAVVADPELQTRLRDQQNARRDDNLFGDGGASMLALQARLLLHYTLLNQVFTAYTNVTTAILDFDNGMKNLQAITTSTNGEMEKLRATVVQTSLGTRFSATEIIEAATAMAQAGLGIREIDKALPSVTLLATATGSTLATAVDISTTALSVFRLRADEMPRVADQMTAALNLSKLTMDQLALGFQYVGTTAAEVGLSFSETTAALATLANQGIRSGSTLGTGFRQMLVDLANPNEALRTRMRELGITMADIDVRSNGLVGVMDNLRRAGFTAADAFATLELRGANSFSAISRGSQEMDGLLTSLRTASGAAEANAVQMESLRSRFLQLTNTINALSFSLTGPLVEGFGRTISHFQDFLVTLNDNSEGLRIFGSVLGGLAVAGTVTFLARLVAGFEIVKAVVALSTVSMGMFTTATSAAAIAEAELSVANATVAATTGTVTAATAAATTGMTVMRAAMIAIPFVAIAGVATAYFLSMQSGSASSRALGEEMERLRQQTNQTKGSFEDQNTTLRSVDEFMKNTVERSRNLTDGSAALNRQVEEARSRFGSLNGELNTTINRYTDLVSVLATTRAALVETARAAATTARAATQAEIASLDANEARGRTQQETRGNLGRLGITQGSLGGVPLAQRPTSLENFDVVLGQFPEGARNNPQFQQALRLLMGQGERPSLNMMNNLNTGLGFDALREMGLPPSTANELRAMLVERTAPLARRLTLGQQETSQVGIEQRLNFEADPRFGQLSDTLRNADRTFRSAGDVNQGPMANRQGAMSALTSSMEAQLADYTRMVSELSAPDRDALARTNLPDIAAEIRSRLSTIGRTTRTSIREGEISIAQDEIASIGREIASVTAEERASTDPAIVATRREQIRTLVERRRALQLSAIPEELTRELGENPMSDVYASRLASRTAGVNAEATRAITEGQIAISRALADNVKAEYDTLYTQITNARAQTRSGGLRGGADLPRLEARAEELIRRRAGLLNQSDEATARDIARMRAPGERATASAGDRAGVIQDRSDTDSKDFQRTTNDALANIDRDARRDIRGTTTEGRADRARLEASRRDPSLITAGEQASLQRQIVERDIAAEIAQIDIRKTEITKLEEQAAALILRIAQVDTELEAASRRTGTTEGNQRWEELDTRARGLRNSQEVIGDRIRSSRLEVERGTALQTAREDRDTGNPISQGFNGAVTQLNNTFGEEGMARGFERDFSSVFGNMRSSFGQFVTDFSSGTKTVGAAAKDMAKSIISSALQIAANRLAGQLLSLGVKAIGAAWGGASGGTAETGNATFEGNADMGRMDASFGQEGAYTGGVIGNGTVQRFARGGMVQGTHLGRDSVNAMLAPGEAVLNRMAVGMVGTDSIHAMNRGLMARSDGMATMPKAREPDLVNVYVMDRAERPQLSAKDIVAVIGEDILTGGATRQLVKQVAMGHS